MTEEERSAAGAWRGESGAASRLNKLRRDAGEEPIAKHCSICWKLKLLDAFSPNQRGHLGRMSQCLECLQLCYNLKHN
jgi:hypothetical protein